MHRKFSDDIFARCLVIMKNVIISFIKEYRGPTLRPPCQIEAVFNVYLFFKMATFLYSDKLFLPEVIPEVE